MTSNTPYFDAQGGLGYKAVLEHFRSQASGVPSMTSSYKTSCKHGGIRVIKVSRRDDKNQSDMPRLEVVDPLESEKNRAASQLKRDAPGENIQRAPAASQTQTGSSSARVRKSAATVRARVKRARDIFDQ